MGAVRDGPESGVYHGNGLIYEDVAECACKVKASHHASGRTASLRTATLALRSCGALSLRCACRSSCRTRRVHGAVLHDDEERNGLARGNEVVHYLRGLALLGPAVLVLAASVLEIEDRIPLGGVLVVLGGNIYECVAHRLAYFRPVIDFADLALGYILLHCVEVLVRCGDVNSAAPAA